MPGIIITPGTFNPPVTPLQLVVGYPLPKVPVRTIRKWRQFSPRHLPGEMEPPGVPLPVNYVYLDFFTGDFGVSSSETLDLAKLTALLSGVRYVADGAYTVTPAGGLGELDGTVAPLFTPSGGVDFGTLDIEQGPGGISWDSLLIELAYAISITGEDGEGDYTFQLVDDSVSGSTAETGTAELRLTMPGADPAGEVIVVDSILTASCLLLKDGTPFETITIGVRVQGTLNFAALSGMVEPTPEPDPLVVAGTWTDTLYGVDAVTTPVAEPTFDCAAYVRDSYAVEGTITQV